MTPMTTTLRRYRMHLAVILADASFVAIFVTVALSGFHQPTPHELPVGVVASAPVTRELQRGLDAHVPGGFDLRSLPSESRARAQIRQREIDGALVITPSGLHLLTGEAGGTAPAQAITAAFTTLAASAGRPLTTTDVVPTRSEDSQGLSSFFLILCVLFPSLAAGIAAGHVLRRTPLAARIAVLVAVAVTAGLAAAAIGDGISGLQHFWAIAGIVALFSLAISAPTTALGQIKPHLAAVCVLVFLVVGLPASGGPANLAAFGPDFLRSLSSGLPLSVAAATVRNTVYFQAADTTGHLWVLTAFATGGIAALCLLVAAVGRLGRRPTTSGAGKLAHARAVTPWLGRRSCAGAPRS
jgi:hypothetical protein